jgi:penicillin-binding protein 1A
VSDSRPRMPWRGPLAAVFILIAVGAVTGGALGYWLKFDLPDVRALEDYTPPMSSRVLARDGSILATFGEQRRILLGPHEIPPVFEQALLAVEDSGFYRHNGIDFKGVLRAAWHDLKSLSLAQGASTITQQLARNLFLRPDKLWRRKLQEILLALEIERQYTKQEILRMYVNQVYMGHGRYGLEAASRFYLAKSASDLTLEEAALLAGIIQRPEGHSPLRDPDRALRRRNFVLQRMVEEKAITPEQAGEARAEPIILAAPGEVHGMAPYFVEEIRRRLQARYGEEGVYRQGLEFRTTLDPRLQEAANRAMDRGLRELDKRQGWRGVTSRLPAGENPETWVSPAWGRGIRLDEVTDAIVIEVARGRARVRLGSYEANLGREEVAWTRRIDPAQFLRPGDVVRVRVLALGAEGGASVALDQDPEVEAALVALDPSTGGVLALVGGFDFERSEFDRAIQARRQAGSAFKPLLYAAALDRGWTPSHRLLDEPTVFLDTTTLVPYQPENYGGGYYGTITLRKALERSANIATVKLLLEVGSRPVIDMARRLGITTELRPYPSMALGAFEVSLLELTSAYATFANQGVRVAPYLVESVVARDGSVLERAEPAVHDALSPQVAYLMNRLLAGVVSDGTGAAAATLGRPLAGKTGTTDDYTDAWFIGYSPDLVLGVWVGYDLKRSLGRRETGALAALPIWKTFMEDVHEGMPPRDFPRPAGVSFVALDRETGLRASQAPGCHVSFAEAFVQGTEPTAYCTTSERDWLNLPYIFQRYPLNEQGELVVPDGDLYRLLAVEPAVRLADGGLRLTALTETGPVSLPLRLTPGATDNGIPQSLLERMETIDFQGRDGRPARVVLLGGG